MARLDEEEKVAFVYPPIDCQAEIDSFNVQSDKFNTVPSPNQQTLLRILDRLETFYEKSKWEIRKDFCSDQHIVDTIENIMKLNHDKNPGAILTREGYTTNQAVVDKLGIEGLTAEVRKRLTALLETEDTKYVADPVRIFQKPEAHKAAKAATKRWRLIWGVSLLDQIVDRMLYGPVCEASLENSDTQAAKPGYNFKGGGIHRMVTSKASKPKLWTSFDASSFDFTVAGWQLDLVRELNERLCITQGSLRSAWITLSKKREEAIKYGSFVFSNGTVCRQTLPGIQKSGRYTTIDGNCKITIGNRVYYDITCQVKSDPQGMDVMGDDQVAYDVGDPQEYVKFCKQQCGITLTVECPPGPYHEQNFCSATITKTQNGIYASVPANYGKCAWGLANMQAKKMNVYAETLAAYCIEYVFHPSWSNFYEELCAVDKTRARSRAYYENIHLKLD